MSQNIHAALQLIPIGNPASDSYAIIDQIIQLIHDSGLTYQVTPFNTVVEAPWADVQLLLSTIQAYLFELPQQEWVLNIQLHCKAQNDVSFASKAVQING
ncbi:MAG: MTH1187 family thiamine-binding protein [Chitinophagaceae bacterium]